ncbi:L,D-transpeptidase [Pyrinomonas sp.]|uniref:L,D-transpeptidase n=1 Tax=Pyrinomonas sp. TaxID=2080306 RepID=UPI00332D1EE5
MMKNFPHAIERVAALALLLLLPPAVSMAQTVAEEHESARSDKVTGGKIERAALVPGDPNIKLTVNVPAFRLTLWQSGKEVATYPIGVGLKEYPIAIGERQAIEIVWNPSWIPPDSDWVRQRENIRPGEIIRASDPRNPLGKMKIPLGNGYLIHEARGPSDLGNLVSHGCIRMLRRDLYDLAEKIIAARALDVSPQQIERAKKSNRTLVIRLDAPLTVDINYDTQVVEEGVLYLYPDVYELGTLTVEKVRDELASAGINQTEVSTATIRRMIARVTRRAAFAASLASLRRGRALVEGRSVLLVSPSVRWDVMLPSNAR